MKINKDAWLNWINGSKIKVELVIYSLNLLIRRSFQNLRIFTAVPIANRMCAHTLCLSADTKRVSMNRSARRGLAAVTHSERNNSALPHARGPTSVYSRTPAL